MQKNNGNTEKNYFDVAVDLGGIKIPVRFDNDFYEHTQKEDRETWINNLEDILNNPSEVWQSYEEGKKRGSVVFLKNTTTKHQSFLILKTLKIDLSHKQFFWTIGGRMKPRRKEGKGCWLKKPKNY